MCSDRIGIDEWRGDGEEEGWWVEISSIEPA